MSGGTDPFDSPALTIAVATLAGVTSQVVGRQVGLPGIVILLGAGVALGPDGVNVVRPESLGSALQILVGFAVAIILFEGGMALHLSRLWRAQKPVRRLVTTGAAVTLIAATVVAKVTMGWSWQLCFLFGSLIIVTGPTVVTPLLKRLQVEPRVATVLEAEGVLIDAVGAITAAVALEMALGPAETTLFGAVVSLGSSLGFGVIAGLVGGVILALLLQTNRIIPEGYENIFALAFVLTLFQATNAVLHESGIAAVTVAGIVLARTKLPVHQELHHFKEQLTSMLIGLLFILLAADVRLDDIRRLGWPGVFAVIGVMAVVRPLNVAAGTFGSTLSWQQRVFIAWIGPRGIIAAAVASLFAVRIGQEGMGDGRALQALVFSVIAVTVLWAGLTGGLVASQLGLRRPKDTGWVILGADELAILLARVLRDGGESIVFIESDPHRVQEAEQEGFRAIFANPFEPRTLQRAEMQRRTGVLAVTPSEDTNFLFAQRAKLKGKAKRLLVALDADDVGITSKMLEKIDAEPWTSPARDIGKWATRIRQRQVGIERWTVTPEAEKLTSEALLELAREGLVLSLTVSRAGRISPLGAAIELKKDDQLTLLLSPDRREEARAALEARAFQRIA